MRLTLALAVAFACSKQPEAAAAAPTPTPTQAPSAIADVPDADVVDAQTAIAATADAAPAPPPGPPIPKVVLHAGDSMVGGYGGLTKALADRFKPLGSRFVPDWQVSVSIQTFDHDKHFGDLLKKYNPDLVILTLGANDVFVPFPSSLASNVASVARKASQGRTCYWITPPLWKPDTGITEVIRKNAQGCKVFDSSTVKIARAGDGIHPTDRGGVDWADKFWTFYQGSGD